MESVSSNRDISVWELKVLLLLFVEIFLRKFNSFLVRHNAQTDLSPITMEAGAFKYHLDSFTSLLQSSPRKEFRTYLGHNRSGTATPKYIYVHILYFLLKHPKANFYCLVRREDSELNNIIGIPSQFAKGYPSGTLS